MSELLRGLALGAAGLGVLTLLLGPLKAGVVQSVRLGLELWTSAGALMLLADPGATTLAAMAALIAVRAVVARQLLRHR